MRGVVDNRGIELVAVPQSLAVQQQVFIVHQQSIVVHQIVEIFGAVEIAGVSLRQSVPAGGVGGLGLVRELQIVFILEKFRCEFLGMEKRKRVIIVRTVLQRVETLLFTLHYRTRKYLRLKSLLQTALIQVLHFRLFHKIFSAGELSTDFPGKHLQHPIE